MNPPAAADDGALQAVEWERARMARVLHDGPVQELTAALLFIDGASQMGNAPDLELLARGMQTLQEAVRSCRRLMDQLTPGLQEPGELRLRVHELVVDRISPTSAEVVNIDVPPDLQAENRQLLHTGLRILEELLDNVARHADGALTSVTVEMSDAALVVEVADAGPGGAKLATTGTVSGLGLAQRRAQSVGGLLRITSTAAGTTAQVRLPVADP